MFEFLDVLWRVLMIPFFVITLTGAALQDTELGLIGVGFGAAAAAIVFCLEPPGWPFSGD